MDNRNTLDPEAGPLHCAACDRVMEVAPGIGPYCREHGDGPTREQAPAPGREEHLTDAKLNGLEDRDIGYLVAAYKALRDKKGTEGGPEAPETAEREVDFRAGFKAGHSRGAWSMLSCTGFPTPPSENEAWNRHRQALEAAPASASPTESETGSDPK